MCSRIGVTRSEFFRFYSGVLRQDRRRRRERSGIEDM